MDLDFVETFYRAAILKNVAQAAKDLHISQGTAHYRIGKLETELGVALVDHTGPEKQFRLTPKGESFVPQAQCLVELRRKIESQLGSAQAEPARLRIGAIESVLHSWLIPLIEKLTKLQPLVTFDLTVETTTALIKLVEQRDLDLVFTTKPASRDTMTRSLEPMPMAFVGLRQWETSHRASLEEIASRNLLTFQEGSIPHANLLDILRAARIDGARVHAITSISAMVRLVAGGFGVATLPIPAVASFAARDDLRPLLCSTELAPLPIHASWRSDLPAATIDRVLDAAQLCAATDPKAHDIENFGVLT